MSRAATIVTVLFAGASLSIIGIFTYRIIGFDYTLPEELNEFEKEGKLEGCVRGLFPGLSSISTDASIDDSSKVDGNFFGSDNKQDTQGCLVINGNKQGFGKDDNKKGKGNFRFLGSFKHDTSNKGFVVFAIAKPTNNKKIKGTGNAYSLEKKENKGASAKKLSVSEKEVDPNNGKFPTPKNLHKSKRKYGGFMHDITDDMEKVCGNDNCNGNESSSRSFEGYGTWWGGKGILKNDKVEEGTDNLSLLGKEIFGDDKGNMAEAVKDMQGSGTKIPKIGAFFSRRGPGKEID